MMKKFLAALSALTIALSGAVLTAGAAPSQEDEKTYVIDGKTYVVDQVVADKTAFGIPNTAAKTDGDTQDFGKDAVVSCGDAQYLLYDFTVDGTIYMDGLFTYTPAEGAQMDNDARKIMFNREFGLDALRAGNYTGLMPLKGTLYETPLDGFEKLHVVFEGGSVTFDTFSVVTVRQVPNEYVIDGKTYIVDQVVADKAALGVPNEAVKTDGDTQDFGKDAAVSCGDAKYLEFNFTVDGTIYMDGLFTYTPAEGAQMDNDARKIMFNRELEVDALRTGNYSGLLPLKGTLYETTLEAFDKLHVVFENGKVTFDTFSLVTLKEKGADPNPDPDPNPNPDLDPDPNPAGKKVEFNLLPQEWSGESTMVPEAADTGWVLKAAAGTEGGNAIGYFGTTYKEGWQLAYDFTIATGNATINMSFVRGLEADAYPGGAPDFCLSKAIADQYGIAAVGPDKTSLPAGTYKGVLDLDQVFKDFDGFDKFQHIGVYMSGTSLTFRELAFVSNVEAGIDKGDNKDDNPVTGVALPIAAAGLTIIAAGVLVISRKRK